MSSKSYFKVTGIVFLIVAVAHLLRSFQGWGLVVNEFEVPVFVSWVGVVIAGYLAYQGLAKK